MSLLRDYFNQTRKPEGRLGKMMIAGMNSGHAKLSDWGFTHLPDLPVSQAVDLGCGGGRSVHVLLDKYPDAKVTGIDYSDLSVEKTRDYNKDAVASGRCEVRKDDVSDLKLPDEFYDLATAFETIYFWPGLENCFAQVARILKPDGYFMICCESDGTDSATKHFEKIIDGMNAYTVPEIEDALQKAGFTDIVSDKYQSKPWITVLAKKGTPT